MRESLLIVSSELRQLMDFAVACRGDAFAPILSLSNDVLARASKAGDRSADPVIVCLNGNEQPGEIADFLAAEPLAVIVESTKVDEPARRIIEAFGQMLFEHMTPAMVVLAGLIAVVKDRSMDPWAPSRETRAGFFLDDAAE